MPRRQFNNHLSPEEMNHGVRMLESDVFQRRVAEILNVSQSVIFQMWNRHLTHRDPSHRHGGGCDRITTRCQGLFLVIQSRRQGLDFARIHVRWTIRDWTPVLFNDESRFCLNVTDRCQLVWKMPKERSDELNVVEHDRYGKGSVMVWKGITVNRKTDLYAIETGTLTALRYSNEILDQFVRPYTGSIGQECILMDDNVHPHCTPPTWNMRQSFIWTGLLDHWT